MQFPWRNPLLVRCFPPPLPQFFAAEFARFGEGNRLLARRFNDGFGVVSELPGLCQNEGFGSQARRKPRLLLLLPGELLLRLADRKFLPLLFQLPPRFTRFDPLASRFLFLLVKYEIRKSVSED